MWLVVRQPSSPGIIFISCVGILIGQVEVVLKSLLELANSFGSCCQLQLMLVFCSAWLLEVTFYSPAPKSLQPCSVLLWLWKCHDVTNLMHNLSPLTFCDLNSVLPAALRSVMLLTIFYKCHGHVLNLSFSPRLSLQMLPCGVTFGLAVLIVISISGHTFFSTSSGLASSLPPARTSSSASRSNPTSAASAAWLRWSWARPWTSETRSRTGAGGLSLTSRFDLY